MTCELLANRAVGGLIGEYRCMDQGEKMDCGANGEVTFCAMGLLLSQSPKISDWVSQRTETRLQVRNRELS